MRRKHPSKEMNWKDLLSSGQSECRHNTWIVLSLNMSQDTKPDQVEDTASKNFRRHTTLLC